jgi:hypothetical protein
MITQLGSPYGHCYLSMAGSTTWDAVELPLGLTAKQIADRESGKTQYSFQVLPNPYRGAAVVGAHLDQAQLGYVYSPFTSDKPVPLFPASGDEVLCAVEALAIELGGLLDDISPEDG